MTERAHTVKCINLGPLLDCITLHAETELVETSSWILTSRQSGRTETESGLYTNKVQQRKREGDAEERKEE